MIRLWRAPWSTNVERVALALAHKGLAVESLLISYEDRSPVEAISGQGLVPVLEDDGVVVVDSTRILRHLERRYPDPRLFPAEPARRAEVDVFIDWFDQVWKVAPNALEAELRAAAPDGDRIAALATTLGEHLVLVERLLDGRDYLYGDFSAADCIAFPFLKFARGRDPEDDEAFHRVLEDYQRPAAARLEGLLAWIERVDAHPRSY
ncbi:MAG TPA: glutathione S-transferase family protein [Thermoleophilaceae bacterium]